MKPVPESLKIVRVLHLVFLASVAMIAALGEVLPLGAVRNPGGLRYSLLVAAVITLLLAFRLRGALVRSTAEALARSPSDPALWARWRTGHLLSFALCEAIAVFGLILRISGETLLNVAPFYLFAFLLLLSWAPRAVFTP